MSFNYETDAKFVVVGNDGWRPVIWGLGVTEEEAIEDALEQEGCTPRAFLHVYPCTPEIQERVQRGDVSWTHSNHEREQATQLGRNDAAANREPLWYRVGTSYLSSESGHIGNSEAKASEDDADLVDEASDLFRAVYGRSADASDGDAGQLISMCYADPDVQAAIEGLDGEVCP